MSGSALESLLDSPPIPLERLSARAFLHKNVSCSRVWIGTTWNSWLVACPTSVKPSKAPESSPYLKKFGKWYAAFTSGSEGERVTIKCASGSTVRGVNPILETE